MSNAIDRIRKLFEQTESIQWLKNLPLYKCYKCSKETIWKGLCLECEKEREKENV